MVTVVIVTGESQLRQIRSHRKTSQLAHVHVTKTNDISHRGWSHGEISNHRDR